MSALDPQHVLWCKRTFDSLADGGIFAIPRSGLVFRRDGAALRLANQMPWEPEMPMNAFELAAYQASEYEAVKEHFEAAGIEVGKGI